jgi:hypothetical protein
LKSWIRIFHYILCSNFWNTQKGSNNDLCSETTHDCNIAAAKIRRILENDLPSKEEDIEKLCAPLQYLLYECQKDDEYDKSDCISNFSSLKQLTKWLLKHVCSHGDYRKGILNEFKNSKNFKDFKCLEYLEYAPCVWSKGQSQCSKSYTNFLNNLKYSDNSLEDNDIALSKLCW